MRDGNVGRIPLLPPVGRGSWRPYYWAQLGGGVGAREVGLFERLRNDSLHTNPVWKGKENLV